MKQENIIDQMSIEQLVCYLRKHWNYLNVSERKIIGTIMPRKKDEK